MCSFLSYVDAILEFASGGKRVRGRKRKWVVVVGERREEEEWKSDVANVG